jgi:glyceraldehyde-3-phosphate dehydrogenase (NADP+)
MKNSGLYIDGCWVEAAESLAVVNPADGSVLGRAPMGNGALMEQATMAAQKAFLRHRQAAASTRSEWLRALAEAIEARSEVFVSTIQHEAGKPVTLARAEVARACATFTVASEEARHQAGGLLDMDALPSGADHFGVARRFPLGVVAALTPFNFPLNLVAHKVAPAIASGNSVVVKPSLRTPLTALLLAEAAEAAGLPAGLLNVVTCPNGEVSAWLANPLVRMISFTGSGPVGRSLHAHALGRRCTLELGGNAAVIVHADADLTEAVPLIARGAFAYSGQSCISVQRVFVHFSKWSAFREQLLAFTKEHIRMGDPSDPAVILGPMIDVRAAERTVAVIQAAVEAGGRLLCGGGCHGAFVEPTIMEHVPETAPIVKEEMFAPVLVLRQYDDVDEAIDAVNASEFGLQAGVFTNDFQLAWKAFNLLETGGVLINQVPTWRTENMPYGGVKASGLGREGVRSAMEEMSELRSWIWRHPSFGER